MPPNTSNNVVELPGMVTRRVRVTLRKCPSITLAAQLLLRQGILVDYASLHAFRADMNYGPKKD